MKNTKFKISAFLSSFFVSSLVLCGTASAAYFELGPSISLSASGGTGESIQTSSAALVGDTIFIPVYVHPENELAFVVDARINFPRELIWAKSFKLAPGWLTVPGEEYSVIDNGLGAARATAGFELATSERMLLGTFEFVAVGPGLAETRVNKESLIFNTEIKDIFRDAGKGNSKIEISLPESLIDGPLQLFDIRLEVEDDEIAPEEPLVARVSFESFGETPTPVDIFFSIIDETGKIYASSDESLVVETETIFTKRFERLDLPIGSYAVHANTRYNVDVEDDFHVPFLVRAKAPTWLIPGGAALAFSVIIIIYSLWLWKKKKRSKRKG